MKIPLPGRKAFATRILALLLGMLPAGLALAQEFESTARIAEIAEQAVARSLPASAQVQAEAPDSRLRLPACEQAPQAEAGPPRGANVSVAVRCAAPAPWQVYVSIRVRDPRPVLVLSRGVLRGDHVEPGLLQPETRDVAQLPFGYVSDAAAVSGYEFRRPLAAGQVPGPDDLTPPKWVRRGDAVQLVGRGTGIEVHAEGKALADGVAGARVAVENSRSKRVVEGVVTAPGLVEIRL